MDMLDSASHQEPVTKPLQSLRQQAAALPLSPGVYLFKNEAGVILYVGKANRLRERVRSYFAADIAETRNPGIQQMVQQSVTIDHEFVDSEPEALLLEARLIRRHKPKYNILLRDDKSFMLVKIDYNHQYPAVSIAREKDLEEILLKKKRELPRENRISQKVDKAEYYGPFPSAYAVRSVLNTIRKIWPYRDCGPQKWAQFSAAGHGCLFASLGLCDAPCINRISPDDYRANINQIRKFLRGDQNSLITEVQQAMQQASEQERYETAAILRDRLQSLQRFRYVVDTFRAANQRKSDAGNDAAMYNPTQDLRIECYDISNNQGDFAVGSLISGIVSAGKVDPITTPSVARERFSLEKARYRKFKIRTVQGISDTAMLQEVLSRRIKRAQSPQAGQWSLPDIILIDGGKGQLHVAEQVRRAAWPDLDATALSAKVAIVSVAKGPTRKRTDLYGADWALFPVIDREAWHTITELLREEAHRFAIGYYRSLHRKGIFQ
jgi:excinuclease ABC subunit C